MRTKPVPGLVALVLGVIITVAVGFALMAGRDKNEPTWTYLGKERSCDQITAAEFASELAFNAWQDQCRS